MKRIILIILGVMLSVPSFARDFTYTYEGQTLTYTVLDEVAKTCMTKEGVENGNGIYAGIYNISGSLTIPEIVKDGEIEYSVTKIGTLSFYYCSDLTEVTIGNSVTSIGNKAFYNCSALKSVTIPSSATEIGYYAFYGCSALKSVTIPNSVTAIPDETFNGCSALESVTIPNSVTSIGDYAFKGCSALKSVTIPNSVTSIGNYAFNGCSSLKDLTIEDGDKAINLGWGYSNSDYYANGLFSECPLNSLYLGRNYKYPKYPVHYRPFHYNKDLAQVIIGSNVTEIDPYAFNGCSSLKSVSILSPKIQISGNPFAGVNLVSYWGSVKPFTGYNSNGSDFTAEKVFWLSNTEPEYKGTKVTYVSTSNVSTDVNLKRVKYLSNYFTADNGLRYIPVSSQNRTAMLVDFDYSLNPENLTIPEKISYKGIEMDVIQAGNYCCSHIEALKHVDVETKLPEIPDGFFYQCKSLKDFVVDRYPTRIGKSAFEGCTSLADFIMLDWTTDVNVGIDAFNNCGLKNIRIGRQLVYPGTEADSPFANNPTLESVWITDIPTSIGAYMFKGCRSLKDVNVGDRVMTIGNYAFAGCSSISRFCFGRSVKSIGLKAFSDCTGMKNLYAEPVSPPICGSQALDDINRWECTLHVQSQSKEAYASAPQWKDFLFFDYGFGLTLNVTSMYMEVGETFQLKVVNNSSSGEVTWKSTNESVLTVSETGLVTAVGSGSASIAAINSDGVMDNCAITVGDDAGIHDIITDEECFDGHYRVYNIQGILVLDTTDETLINTLPTGFYIINGKKYLIR